MQSTWITHCFFAAWICIAIVLVILDIRSHQIPRLLNLIGVVCALILGWLTNGLFVAARGGILAFGLLCLAYGLGQIYKHRMLARNAPENGEAFGRGDVIFGIGLGFLLGGRLAIQGLLIGIFLAGLFGVIGLLMMRVNDRCHSSLTLPLIPFLLCGGLLSMFILVLPK